MDLYEVLEKVIELLQRHGRLSYRALKVQFELDGDRLDLLKEELIEIQQLAVDQDDRMLVWTGETGSPDSDTQRGTENERHFQALLPAVMALLRQEGQVTYRSIKYIFSIDDALLEAIREELTFKQLAYDKDGKGLVWTGESRPIAQTAMAPTRSPATPEAVSVTSSPSSGLSLPTSEAQLVSAPDAERRQLTVMFCDLADSTQLSHQLDPEDLREVIRAYQATATDVIQQYEGHMAQYLGDGLLVYFGWPVAHEDDAQRALHAGLGIVDAIMTTLNPNLKRDKNIQLTVRLGIHTGPVVWRYVFGRAR